MKTRSAPIEAPNIAAIVKARHHARILCPINDSIGAGQQQLSVACGSNEGPDTAYANPTSGPGLVVGSQTTCDEPKTSSEEKTKSRTDGTRATWSPDDRRLFFQAVRLYGRNFTEITRFIRSRGHRILVDWTAGLNTGAVTDHGGTGSTYNYNTSGSGLTSGTLASGSSTLGVQQGSTTPGAPSIHSSASCASIADLNAPCGGLTREQVRFFYQQTWQKIRRYIKFPEEVPQHAREVYALVNYSVIRTRIKKPLDHRLGERLNELVHCGTTVIRHNGRRFLLRTPVCQALKQLNHFTAPTHEFLLPEDIWVELVPSTQNDLWRVIEAEQNPRLRLRVDINRQLSDLIGLVENKWQLAAERLQTLFGLPNARDYQSPRLLVRITPTQTIDGAIRLQEVARIRSGDMALRAYLERRLASASTTTTTVTSTTTTITTQPNTLATTTDSNSGEHSSGWTTDCGKPGKDGAPELTVSAAPNTDTTNTLTSTGGLQSVCSPTANAPAAGATCNSSSSSTTTAELDLRETGKQLAQGVTFEAARGIKLLTIFLALGCPDRIRFEYSFVIANDATVSSNTPSCVQDKTAILACPPNDPDGQGISNGLRRLLHLNASDYLLHREWASRQAILNTPTIAPMQTKVTGLAASSSLTTATTVAMNQAITSKILNTTTTAVTPSSISARENNKAAAPRSILPSAIVPFATTSVKVTPSTSTSPVTSSCPTTGNVNSIGSFMAPIPIQPAVSNLPVTPFLTPINSLSTSVLRPSTDAVQLVVADAVSVSKTSVTNTNTTSVVSPRGRAAMSRKRPVPPTSATSAAPITTTITTASVPTVTPNLLVFPKAVSSKGQVAVVERRLDVPQNIQSRTCVPLASKPLAPPVIIPAPKVPISKYRTPDRNPPQIPRPIQPAISIAPATSVPKQSSLSALKAFNTKRRSSTTPRGPRRIASSTLAARSLAALGAHVATSATNPLSVALPRLTLGSSGTQSVTQFTSTSAGQTVNATATSATSRATAWPSTTAFIQGFTTLTPTVSVLNASSLLFGDGGDTTLGTLFDPSGTNQSSISAMSQDTLASLLNTICHPSQPISSESMVGNTDRVSVAHETDHVAPPRSPGARSPLSQDMPGHVTSYKCEDSMERGDWNDIGRFDFHGSSRFCPSASTPHLPPASPAFADISLTDSMAAAVMDTHDGELNEGDFGDAQVPGFSVRHGSKVTNFLESIDTPGLSPTHPVDRNTDYTAQSTTQSLLRANPSESNEVSTIDLNSLMRSMNQNS